MTTKQKQRQLKYLGYYGGSIDGKWGPKSKAAAKAFQKENSLDDDGIFGSKTKAMSKAVIKNIQKAIGMPAKQQDGLAGPKTESYTVSFQKANGLEADGIAGPKTRARLKELNKKDDGDFWDEIKHFTRSEFKCNCGGEYCDGYPAEPKKELVVVADRLREHFGFVLQVNSGVRCQQYNDTLKGSVQNSRHTKGKAMDFKIKTDKGGYLSAKKILAVVNQQPEIRYAYAINSRSVHMDIE